MRNVKTVPPSPTYRHLTMSCSTYPTLNAMSPVKARNKVARPSARRWPSKSIWPSTTSRTLSRISSAMLRDASSLTTFLQSAFPRVGSCVGGGISLEDERASAESKQLTMSAERLHARNSRHVFRGDACGANLRTGKIVGPQPGEVWRCELMSLFLRT